MADFSTQLSGKYIDLQMSAAQGLNPLMDEFKAFCELLEAEVLPESMVEALDPTLDLAKVYCPVRTGALHDSGYVEAEDGPEGPEAQIGFGKNDEPPYAVMVHELPAHHAPPTQNKFLERAVYEDSLNVMDRLYRSIKTKAGT